MDSFDLPKTDTSVPFFLFLRVQLDAVPCAFLRGNRLSPRQDRPATVLVNPLF